MWRGPRPAPARPPGQSGIPNMRNLLPPPRPLLSKRRLAGGTRKRRAGHRCAESGADAKRELPAAALASWARSWRGGPRARGWPAPLPRRPEGQRPTRGHSHDGASCSRHSPEAAPRPPRRHHLRAAPVRGRTPGLRRKVLRGAAGHRPACAVFCGRGILPWKRGPVASLSRRRAPGGLGQGRPAP